MRETHQYVVMHYGEVSIKGKNRPTFLRRLVRNVQQALGDLGDISVEMLSGRLLVAVPIEVPWACLEERLRSIFGLANFARCARSAARSRGDQADGEPRPARPHLCQFSDYGAPGF